MAQALWTDPELEAGVTLDGVVTVVDARHVLAQLAAPPADAAAVANEAQQQVAYANVVLVNKVLLRTPALCGISCHVVRGCTDNSNS